MSLVCCATVLSPHFIIDGTSARPRAVGLQRAQRESCVRTAFALSRTSPSARDRVHARARIPNPTPTERPVWDYLASLKGPRFGDSAHNPPHGKQMKRTANIKQNLNLASRES